MTEVCNLESVVLCLSLLGAHYMYMHTSEVDTFLWRGITDLNCMVEDIKSWEKLWTGISAFIFSAVEPCFNKKILRSNKMRTWEHYHISLRFFARFCDSGKHRICYITYSFEPIWTECSIMHQIVHTNIVSHVNKQLQSVITVDNFTVSHVIS